MKTTLIKTRRFNKETYYIYLHQPSFTGESGCLGIDLESYVTVETPENCFGYPDTVHFNSFGYGYCLHRLLPNWIMRELEKENKNILKKYATI
jgi:hypothetical protein